MTSLKMVYNILMKSTLSNVCPHKCFNIAVGKLHLPVQNVFEIRSTSCLTLFGIKNGTGRLWSRNIAPSYPSFRKSK